MSNRPHGYARYRLDGCRCYPCAAARSRYDENRTKAITAGTWQPWTDATPVREHLAHLRSCGMGLRTIADLSGIDRKRLQAVLGGRPERGTPPQTKVRPDLAVAVLAVDVSLETLAPATLMGPVGTRRRCHALVARGWPQQHLANHVGMTLANFGRMLSRPNVLVGRHLQVLAMYDALWNTDPAAAGATPVGISRARAYAVARGWAPPGGWDDDTIDDPTAVPDWTGVCGTPAGPSAHSRLGVPVCDPCRHARAEARRESRAAA
jgi:hypothetical protein